jgi:hypothetical protein
VRSREGSNEPASSAGGEFATETSAYLARGTDIVAFLARPVN